MEVYLCQVTSEVIRMLGNELIINSHSITHVTPIRISLSQKQINLDMQSKNFRKIKSIT